MYEPGTDEDPQPISQADEIRHLRAEIRDLTARLNNGGRCPTLAWQITIMGPWLSDLALGRTPERRHRSERRKTQLQKLFATIRSAPLELVDRLITQLRTGPSGSNELEGTEGGCEMACAPVQYRAGQANSVGPM